MPEPTEIPVELTLWMAKATEGLCEQARERVRKEMVAHYRDALEAERAAGRTEAEAAELARYALGNPDVAHRELQSVYPTTREARIIREWVGKPSVISFFTSATWCILLLLLAISMTQQKATQHHLLPLVMMDLTFALMLISLAAKLFHRHLNSRLRSILWLAGEFSIIAFLFLTPVFPKIDIPFLSIICYVSGALWMLGITFDYLRIWRKWERHPELLS